MTIETGSQNASRTPGVFAYPVQKYNPSPVESVKEVKERSPRPSSGADFRLQNQQRIDRETHLPPLYTPAHNDRNAGITRDNQAGTGQTGGLLASKRDNTQWGRVLDLMA